MPGSPRLVSFCRELSRSHKISLVAVSGSQERREQFENDPQIAGVFEEMTFLSPAPKPTWPGKQRHRFHLASHYLTKYTSPEYYRGVCGLVTERMARNGAVDAVYVDGLSMTQYLDSKRDIPAVVDLHDSHTLLLTRTIRIEPDILNKLRIYLEKRSVAKWEASLKETFDLVITNSAVDEAMIKKLAPSTATLTIPNGVDVEYFSASRNGGRPERLVFTGVIGYGPNEDAVLYFCRDVFPLIRAQNPGVEFWAVGHEPSVRVRSLAEQPGVHVTGSVDDIRPYVQSAGIYICPLRYGSGVKNKILAAMAMGKPVVATPVSLEGIEVRGDHDVLIADSPGEFAAKVSKLLADEVFAKKLGENGCRLVRDKYSWKAKAQLLENVLRDLIKDRRFSRD
jgi:glycosyltransferase involved in cell wall biosynthesis